ncbi:IclR family transcriptional regulator [Microbacterium terregens]|uniref:IclR family transcriptional regulator n=1 Tax=Microbacterium terregens TaxID=69363 RepID=A0ABV5T5F2_9MICO
MTEQLETGQYASAKRRPAQPPNKVKGADMTSPAKPEPSARGDIQVVSRVAALLDCFTLTSKSLDIQRAASVLGVGKSTAHRYLASMEKSRLLERDDLGKYVLGPSLVRIGAVAFAGPGLVEAAGPVMTELASGILSTIVLSVWGGDAPVVARVERNTQQTTTVAVDVGRSLEPYSAQAMLFRAYRRGLDGESADSATISEHTIPDSPTGEKVMVARTTYADGALRAISVPVLSRNGSIVASLAVLGFGVSLPEADDEMVIAQLITGSRKMQNS